MCVNQNEVGEQDPPQLRGEELDLRARRHVTRWEPHLAQDVIGHQHQQLTPAGHVPVQRRAARLEHVAEPAHGQGVEPVPVHERERRVDDALDGQPVRPWPPIRQ